MNRQTLLFGAFFLLAGCRGGKGGGPSLDTMVLTLAAQLADTLLPPPSRSLSAPSDPPLLGPGGKTQVILIANEPEFVTLIGNRLTPKDVRTVVKKVSEELNRTLQRRRCESVAGEFPAQVSEAEASRSLIATLTPSPLVTGGPEDKAKGKSQTLLMARLVITDAKTGQALAQREFFSGYTLPR